MEKSNMVTLIINQLNFDISTLKDTMEMLGEAPNNPEDKKYLKALKHDIKNIETMIDFMKTI